MGDLTFSMRDIYPTYVGVPETSNRANVDVEDREAMAENPMAIAASSGNQSSAKYIFIAFGLMIAIIIFLGGN